MGDFVRHYPHAAINAFVKLLDPGGTAELVVRISKEEAPIRHQDPARLSSFVSSRLPRDGVHLALSATSSAFVLDVDLSSTRPVYCSCTDGGKLICDNCWLILAGAMRGYVYILRHHFGCRQILACFSGGRGWHMFVMDASLIDKIQATHMFAELVPNATRHVAEYFCQIRQQLGAAHLWTMRLFDPAHRFARCTDESRSDHGPLLLRALLDPLVLRLYANVMVPFFCEQWVPRVLGCRIRPADAVGVAGAIMIAMHGARHGEGTRSTCPDCIVITAYQRAEGMFQQSDKSLPIENRIDAFLALTSLLWEQPDANLTASNHAIRLPWSPHQRSGNFSLPLPLDRAHELRPQSFPPRWADVGTSDTMGNAWFQLSLKVMDDLLVDYQLRPGISIWPT